MAHDLSIRDGVAEFAYNRNEGRPWHSLGVAADGFMKPIEATRRHLNWTVETVPLHTTDGLEIPSTRGIVRVNPDESRVAFPGAVGIRFTPIQNDTVARTLETLFGTGNAVLDTLGALGRGERVFWLAKLPAGFEVVKGDKVERYFLVENRHDGTSALRLRYCSTRVCCSNTLGIALRERGHVVSIRHTKNAEEALKLGAEILAGGEQYWSDLRAFFASMAARQLSAAEFQAFLAELVPGEVNEEGVIELTPQARRVRDNITELFEGRADGSDMAPGSAWSAFNSVTQHIDRDRPVRSGTNRIEASLFGEGAAGSMRQRAADLLAAL